MVVGSPALCSSPSAARISVRRNSAADRLGRDSAPNLDVGLLNDHSCGNGFSAAAAVFSCQDPFAVGVGKLVYGDDADALGIVAAVSGTKAHSPFCLEKQC